MPMGTKGTPWGGEIRWVLKTDGVRERDRFVGGGLVVFVCFFLGSEKQSLNLLHWFLQLVSSSVITSTELGC